MSLGTGLDLMPIENAFGVWKGEVDLEEQIHQYPLVVTVQGDACLEQRSQLLPQEALPP